MQADFDVVSKTSASVSSDIQTLTSGLKKRDTAELFSTMFCKLFQVFDIASQRIKNC